MCFCFTKWGIVVMGVLSSSILFKYESRVGHLFVLSLAIVRRVAVGRVLFKCVFYYILFLALRTHLLTLRMTYYFYNVSFPPPFLCVHFNYYYCEKVGYWDLKHMPSAYMKLLVPSWTG